MSQSITSALPVFFDRDGSPLEAGNIYVGTKNLSPKDNQVTVYWDEALTVPASQPIKTVAGYLTNNGTRSRVFFGSNEFSLGVFDKNNVLVYQELDAGVAVDTSALPDATPSTDGLMTAADKAKLDGISTGAGPTNLSTTQTTTTVDVVSDTGTDATLPQAIASGNAGVMSGADKAKLDGVESGATADQSDAEIETAYNNQVGVVSQATAEAGTSTTVERWTAQRVGQAIAALAPNAGAPTTVAHSQVTTGTINTSLSVALNLTTTNVGASASFARITVRGNRNAGSAPFQATATSIVGSTTFDYSGTGQQDAGSATAGATLDLGLTQIRVTRNGDSDVDIELSDSSSSIYNLGVLVEVY